MPRNTNSTFTFNTCHKVCLIYSFLFWRLNDSRPWSSAPRIYNRVLRRVSNIITDRIRIKTWLSMSLQSFVHIKAALVLVLHSLLTHVAQKPVFLSLWGQRKAQCTIVCLEKHGRVSTCLPVMSHQMVISGPWGRVQRVNSWSGYNVKSWNRFR